MRTRTVGGIVFSVIFATFSLRAQDALQIVQRSLAADNDNALITSQYIYEELETTRELDRRGHAKTTKSERREILFIGGRRYEHLLEKDGKALPPGEARREQARIDKAAAEASKLTEAERARRFEELRRKQEKEREQVKSIPDAYTFTLAGSATLNGREAFVILARPRPEYRGKFDNIFRNTQGKLFIDRKDYEWVRAEVDVLNDIPIGLFLAKVSKGARLTFEQTRVNDEVWLPKSVTIKAGARNLFMHMNVEEEVAYGKYRRFRTDARIVDTAEAEKK